MNALSQYARLVNETPTEAARNIYVKIRTAGSAVVRPLLKSKSDTNAQNELCIQCHDRFPCNWGLPSVFCAASGSTLVGV